MATNEFAELLGILAQLGDDEVLEIGVLNVPIATYFPDLVTHSVIVTGNRRGHYLTTHPQVQEHEDRILQAALSPEEIHLDPYRVDTFSHYVALSDRHDVKVLVRYSRSSVLQNSVITAFICRKRDRQSGRRRGLLRWEK